MTTDYMSITPIAQFDETSCWAAALEWWAKATGRVAVSQLNLISKYQQYWDSTGDVDSNPNYGTVSKSNLMLILSDPCWRMRCEEIRGAAFNQTYLNGKLPCYVAYYEQEVGGSHAVVVCAADETVVKCMDPAFGGFRNFRYGQFQRTRTLIVGWPR